VHQISEPGTCRNALHFRPADRIGTARRSASIPMDRPEHVVVLGGWGRHGHDDAGASPVPAAGGERKRRLLAIVTIDDLIEAMAVELTNLAVRERSWHAKRLRWQASSRLAGPTGHGGTHRGRAPRVVGYWYGALEREMPS